MERARLWAWTGAALFGALSVLTTLGIPAGGDAGASLDPIYVAVWALSAATLILRERSLSLVPVVGALACFGDGLGYTLFAPSFAAPFLLSSFALGITTWYGLDLGDDGAPVARPSPSPAAAPTGAQHAPA